MRGIGFFLGLLIGAPLVFFLISYIFLRPRKVNDEELKLAFNDLGVAYFKLNDFQNAKKYWKKASDLGNPTSLNNLKEIEKK